MNSIQVISVKKIEDFISLEVDLKVFYEGDNYLNFFNIIDIENFKVLEREIVEN